MIIWAEKKLGPNGELQWERDIWNGSALMELWMLLATYQRHGIGFSEMEDFND